MSAAPAATVPSTLASCDSAQASPLLPRTRLNSPLPRPSWLSAIQILLPPHHTRAGTASPRWLLHWPAEPSRACLGTTTVSVGLCAAAPPGCPLPKLCRPTFPRAIDQPGVLDSCKLFLQKVPPRGKELWGPHAPAWPWGWVSSLLHLEARTQERSQPTMAQTAAAAGR